MDYVPFIRIGECISHLHNYISGLLLGNLTPPRYNLIESLPLNILHNEIVHTFMFPIVNC